jgi:hypothetical protein
MACDHKGCHCTETLVEENGKNFCSEQCAESEASGNKSGDCTCGHPDCAAI